MVGLWGLCVTALDATRYVGTVTSPASDPDPRVRAYATGTLSTVFGAGYPPATLAVLADGTRDPASEVRRAAVRAPGRRAGGRRGQAGQAGSCQVVQTTTPPGTRCSLDQVRQQPVPPSLTGAGGHPARTGAAGASRVGAAGRRRRRRLVVVPHLRPW